MVIHISCTARDADDAIVMKIMKTQMKRDDRIDKLFTTMNSFYDIVSDIEPEKIESLRDLLRRIAQQTTECCYFIRDYAKTKGFGKPCPSAVRHSYNDFMF